MIGCAAYLEIVAAHADGALGGDELAAAERHRSACPPCGRVFVESAETRRLVATRCRFHALPASLRRRIQVQIGAGSLRLRSRPPASRLLMQGVVAAVALFAVAVVVGRSPTPVQLVADDVHRAARGEFEPEDGAPAPSTVSGLEAGGWRCVGGRRGTWGTMRGTMTVYESTDGKTLVLHEMDAGPDFAMPAGGHRSGDRMEYFVDGVVVSIALRGSTISCLAGRMPLDEFHRRVVG